MSLTREQRRRRRARQDVLLLAVCALLFVLAHMVAGEAAETPQEPVKARMVTIPPDTAETAREEPVEAVAVNYSSLDTLEYIGTFTATAYCACIKCCGIWSAEHPDRPDDFVQRTASGTIPAEGRTIAADWDVLPSGSKVVINGHTYTVEDTGAAIEGRRLDIYFDDHQTAREYGVREIDVYQEKE